MSSAVPISSVDVPEAIALTEPGPRAEATVAVQPLEYAEGVKLASPGFLPVAETLGPWSHYNQQPCKGCTISRPHQVRGARLSTLRRMISGN